MRRLCLSCIAYGVASVYAHIDMLSTRMRLLGDDVSQGATIACYPCPSTALLLHTASIAIRAEYIALFDMPTMLFGLLWHKNRRPFFMNFIFTYAYIYVHTYMSEL